MLDESNIERRQQQHSAIISLIFFLSIYRSLSLCAHFDRYGKKSVLFEAIHHSIESADYEKCSLATPN